MTLSKRSTIAFERVRRATTVALGLLAGCERDAPAPGTGAASGSASATAPSGAPNLAFTDVTAESGIHFVHVNGAQGRRHLPETMGGSAAWADFDSDGDFDLFLGQSGGLADSGGAFADAKNGIYRNDGGGKFADVTDSAGAATRTGYGQGVAAGDYDGDGRVDLFVTNYGPDVLLRNVDGSRFEDATAAAGVGDPAWGTSAAFFDMDADGDLDLYVVNYVQFSLTDYKRMSKDPNGFLAYSHPDQFRSARDTFYRNGGNGTFEDATVAAGFADVDGKGLGIAPVDFDRDGDLDVYVANDSTPNFLFRNEGGRVVDWSQESNAGYNRDGKTEASMGIAVADCDGDRRLDLMLTNLDGETNTLYVNQGGLVFEDLTDVRGLAQPSLRFVGFGIAFLDLEFDGDDDLLVGNGHIIDNIDKVQFGSGITYAQRCLLHRNNGKGAFKDVVDALPESLKVRRVVRALALCDFDQDGDKDVLLAQNNAPAALLRNDCARMGHSLELEIVDAAGHVSYGATVEYRSGDRIRIATGLVAASYCASHDPRVILSALEDRLDEVSVRWVTGETLKLTDVAMDRVLTIAPSGITAERSTRVE